MFPKTLRLLSALLFSAIALTATAQQSPTDLQPLPGIVDDPAQAPQVTIRKQGEDKVEEYRMNGKLYMVKVTPPHGKPYYLVDRKGNGSFMQEETAVGDKGISVPMWVIHTF